MANRPELDPLRIALTVNGEALTVEAPPGERLLDLLRYRLALPGTKEGCGEGECGACTVLMNGLPVNSCLVLASQARGATIDTVESVDPGDLARLHEAGATQCGACSPGVVTTARWIGRHPELLETHTLRELMAGNLCRCTGYEA
ncbi:MAG: (2Fe-2S)-binding protein, partial [Planctomycetota bacterium]